MELNNLRPAKGSNKSRKRIARGQGSGRGGTSTKGHKGDKSRAGHKDKRGHEGGQMPLQMRIPKFGFKNINRVEYVGVNLNTLNFLAETYNLDTIDQSTLIANNVVKKAERYKILGTGDLNFKLTVSGHAVSKTAKEKIEQQGGTITII